MNAVTEPVADERRTLLEHWLRHDLGFATAHIAPASADASFRRYFRCVDASGSYIVMDAPPEREDLGPFIAAAAALAAMGVTVPAVLATHLERGFLLLSDLGATHYLAALRAGGDADALYAVATEALLRIQCRGGEAAASLPSYGVALLDRDVQLFPEWFLGRHLGMTVTPEERDLIEWTSARLAAVALEQPQVYVHRDYHSRNLMTIGADGPGILDFQDAIRGAVTYDLVSLFKDCYVVWPRRRVLDWIGDYRRRAIAAGLPIGVGEDTFVRWFDLMGLQRHLKVLGIFARLWHRDGKSGYLGDLPTVWAYVLETTGLYPELAELDRWLRTAVAPRFAVVV
jgi:hypothetical protein